ncbi:MAG: efflux RND transporter periplasmic adaptor subunit, partial [Acidobacteria bacterium]|nr:efflux RND transporter periplasmic adaptor subunit [Acidobacteriota bacterium]
RSEEDLLFALAVHGSARMDWTVENVAESIGMASWRSGSAAVQEGPSGAYRSALTGVQLAQVAGVPLRGPKGIIGCIELWWKATGGKPAASSEILALLEDVLNKSLPALLEYESERRNYVNAISRLMMLYDIGKVFHSTLEMEELAPVICTRVLNILEAESATVWMLDPVKRNLYCAAAEGPRTEAMSSARVWASDAGLGTTVSQGEAVLLHNVVEPEWTDRWGGSLRSLLAVPLMSGNRFLGAIEAVRGADARYFTEEDLRLLIDVAKQATVSLRNAQRLQAERRVNELNALMEISKEITATLDLDRVLTTTVNRITSVIPCDRCTVALHRKGRLDLCAVSGEMKLDRKAAGMPELEAMHVWLAGSGGDCTVLRTEEGIDAEREETRDKFGAYFDQAGMSAFMGLLLRDEESIVGTLVLEGKEPGGLSHGHYDLARIFASQVTVAVRNALLYQQMPLAGVLQPLAERRARFAAIPAARRSVMITGAVAILAFLTFFPWWSKPSGEARVLPALVQPVSAEVEGVVRNVRVREGARVNAGDLLAEVAPEEMRVALQQAQSKHEILSRHVLQLEAAGDLGEARMERARMQQASAELDLARSRLAATQIRSPISGVVITPRLEEREGQLLHRGDVFCQVVDAGRAWVEIAVSEREVGEIEPEQEAWLKLNTFPDRKFVGHVVRISPQGREQSDDRVFDVIVEVPNGDQMLRAGMMGRGKVLARRAPVGYLMFRAPIRWLWLKVWSWLP